MLAVMVAAVGMVRARPASLRSYARAAEAMASDVRRVSPDVGAAIEAARASAVDVAITVEDVGGLLDDVARLLSDTGAAVEDAAQAFEAADSSGAALLRARDAHVEARLSDSSSWEVWTDRALGFLAHPATRGSLLGAGGARTAQMWLAAHRYADAWVDRAFTRAFYRLAGGTAALPYRMVFRFDRAREVASAVRGWGRPEVNRFTAGMDEAARVFRHGKGLVRTVGRVAAPLAALGDTTVLFGGSQYDGARGTADQAMAGVGLVGVGALALTATFLAPVAAPVALVAGTAAVVWGVGNLVVDNWEAISSGASTAASAVVDGGRRVLATVTDPVSSGVRAVGRVLGFGG